MVKTFKQHSFKEKYEGEPGVGTTEYEDSIEDSNIGPHNIHEKMFYKKLMLGLVQLLIKNII